MTFAEDIISDLANVFFNTDAFAETVTYNGTDISAIVTREASGDTPARRATIMVQASDVAGPDYRDEVVFDGATWRVQFDTSDGPAGITSSAGDVWKLTVVRDSAPQFWK